MKRRLLFVLLLALGLFLPQLTHAESIMSLDVRVDITRQGVANFIESIDYIFTSSRHGIYRDIPFSTQLPNGKYLNYTLVFSGVTRDGKTEPAEQSDNGAYRRFKIGSASSTIQGAHLYQISYSLSPVVRKDPKGDYITLNLHGTGWEVSADKISGVVTLPAGIAVQDAECFTGQQGERGRLCSVVKKDNVVTVTADSGLAARNGLTVDILTPANSFEAGAYITPSDTSTAVSENKQSIPWVFFVVVLIVVASMVLLAVRTLLGAWRRHQGKRAQTVVAQYEAPDSMTPGEVGLIDDEVGAMREITATIIDLARRGWLKITYTQDKGWLGTKQKFIFTQKTGNDELQIYEVTLLNAIFTSGSPVELGTLSKTAMSTAVSSVHTNLASRLKQRGWYKQSQSVFSAENLTPAGYQEWAKVEGLKLYLNVAEKDRMKFAEAPERTPERFTKLLPYAIALGVEKEWAKQFEGIDVSSATSGWYSGSDVANAYVFANMLSSSFASSINSSFSPPTTSGGAGGGFSGGGAGGGGGGSW